MFRDQAVRHDLGEAFPTEHTINTGTDPATTDWRKNVKMKPNLFTALVAATLLTGSLVSSASAQGAVARNSMEQCVDRVMEGLLKKKSTDIEVGRAVTTQCDKQLRATLAEAIKNGEASSCTVEKCIGVARDEATREARELYRSRSAAR